MIKELIRCLQRCIVSLNVLRMFSALVGYVPILFEQTILKRLYSCRTASVSIMILSKACPRLLSQSESSKMFNEGIDLAADLCHVQEVWRKKYLYCTYMIQA